MNFKWYRNPEILAALVIAIGSIVAALVTRWEWKTVDTNSESSNELSIAKPADKKRRLAVRIFPEIERKQSQKFRKELRERDGLRPLFILETSQKLVDAPAKTFFSPTSIILILGKGKLIRLLRLSAMQTSCPLRCTATRTNIFLSWGFCRWTALKNFHQ